MNITSYIFHSKIISIASYTMVLLSCIFRFAAPYNNQYSLAEVLDLFVFLMYPLVLWIYIQRVYRYYSNNYIWVRKKIKLHPLFIQLGYGLLTAFVISVVICIMNALLYYTSLARLDTFLFYIKIIAVNTLLVSLFHVIAIIQADSKMAFILAYLAVVILYVGGINFLLGFLNSRIAADSIIIILSILCVFVSYYITWAKVKKDADIYAILC